MKNYEQLTNDLTKLFDKIKDDEITLAKAHAMVKTANAVVAVQKAKLLAIKEAKQDMPRFFNDN